MRFGALGLAFEWVALRSKHRFRRWWDHAALLLEDVGQFVREQLLSGSGMGLIASAPEVDIAACSEGVRADAVGRLGGGAVIVYPDIVEAMTEAVLHHHASVRRQR